MSSTWNVVSFSVCGVRQSPVQAKLVKDGKALSNKDVEIVVQDDKVVIKLKKPLRENSGKYEIKLTNAQGESTKEVVLNIQGNVEVFTFQIIFFFLLQSEMDSTWTASVISRRVKPHHVSVFIHFFFKKISFINRTEGTWTEIFRSWIKMCNI